MSEREYRIKIKCSICHKFIATQTKHKEQIIKPYLCVCEDCLKIHRGEI